VKTLLRILAFSRPYLFQGFLNVFFNVLAIVFSLVSVSLIIPVLGILFGTQEKIYTLPEWSIGNTKDIFYYHITQMIESQGASYALGFICIFVVASYLFKNIFRYFSLFFLAKFRNGTLRQIRNALHEKVLALPMQYQTDRRKGDLLARMTTDITEIEWGILMQLEVLLREPFMIIASLSLMLFISPQLTLFVFILLPVSAFLIATIGRSLKRKNLQVQNMLGELISYMEETLTGMKIIKAFTAEKRLHERFSKANIRYNRMMNRVLHRKDLSSPISEVLGASVISFVIYYGGMLILEGDTLKPELFIGYLLIFFQVIAPARNLSNAAFNIQKGNASAQRIFEVLDYEVSIKDAPDAQPKKTFDEAIVIRNLRFGYEPGQWVLDDINLTIKKGETVALVGPSGSGKTTLAHLIPRFYDYMEGDILIDGIPVPKVKIADLRGLMAMVTQESILFNDTVANNLKLGAPNATAEEVERAAKMAHAEEFIVQLPLGYENIIGDSGSRLSGGQRQRLSIARAILSDPQILILDEATSALDTESERLVQDALEHLMKDRTSIVIAHRLSTVIHADKIVVMQQGKVIEVGTHKELMESSALYKKLIELQNLS
jgi:ATP-binding cassette, subfamily B, bacterial MsbA